MTRGRKLLKQKVLGSYPVLVETHKTLNSIRGVICSQVDGCSDKEIQVGFTDQYIFKVYCVHKK
jgi:hypothetical protein